MHPPIPDAVRRPRMSTSHRRATAVLTGLVLALGAVGCSSEEKSSEPSSSSSAGSSDAAQAPKHLAPQAKIVKVTGKVPAKRRWSTKRAVVARIDRWLEQAYLAGDYPRSVSSLRRAFASFTWPAQQQAWHHRGLMSNAPFARRAESVTPRRKVIELDMLGVDKKVAGVSARVGLVYDLDGEVKGRFRSSGHVELTWSKKNGWRIFAFDMHRDRVRASHASPSGKSSSKPSSTRKGGTR